MSKPIVRTILVAEDEPLLLKFVQTILERDRYSVLAAASPTQAVHIGQDPKRHRRLAAYGLLPAADFRLRTGREVETAHAAVTSDDDV